MFPEARGLEFVIIAALALVVVGPKELPNLLRKLGQFVGKMRSIANDFRTSFDEMARQSELDDLRRQVEEMRADAARHTSYDPTGLTDAVSEFQMTSSPVMTPDPEPVIVEEAPPPTRKRAAPKAASAKAAPAKTAGSRKKTAKSGS